MRLLHTLTVLTSASGYALGPQEQTTTLGLSTLGTFDAPRFGKILGNLDSGIGDVLKTLWAGLAANGPAPRTGIIRSYDFSLSRGYISPDGYKKSAILINGQFPGPTIEANWGDTIRVTVHNNINTEMAEGTSLHWHGMLQRDTPYFDGVPGVSQCPIAPGTSFTYTFLADQYGTSWYHSHYSAQYNDGLFGAMIIHGPLQPGVDYDIDLGPILLTDFIHTPYYEEMQQVFSIPPVFPNVDNNLINGKGVIDCRLSKDPASCDPNAKLSRFKFETGKTYRLRLINASGAANQKFAIDGHTLEVIANDFVPIQPYTTNVVTLGIGQRTDILVKATGSPRDAVWMRSDIDLDCFNLTSTTSQAKAAIYYSRANTAALPKTTATPWNSNHCRNDPLEKTIPYYPLAPPPAPEFTQNLEITLGVNETGHVVFCK
jgi:FtsP/CotA-like multicopper oxidase with cupredoxin domain